MTNSHLNIPNFKIAFTFTGEYRDSHVRPVCEELLELGFSKDDIFFDDWHPELYNGISADAVFREIYHNSSECIVVLLSPNYKEKKWTYNVEWQTVRALINKGEAHKICLLDIDNVDISTIEGLSSYRDVSKPVDYMSPKEIAKFVYEWYNIRVPNVTFESSNYEGNRGSQHKQKSSESPKTKEGNYQSSNFNQDSLKIAQEHIVDSKGLLSLEASVGNYPKERTTPSDDIYIQASRFLLENADLFQQIVVWNFRKGVTYHYLIPYDPVKQDEFIKFALNCYIQFSAPLESKEKYESFYEEIYRLERDIKFEISKYWSMVFEDIVEYAKMIWEETSGIAQQKKLYVARKRCIDLFLHSLHVSVIDSPHFYLTTALYEIKDSNGKHRQWKGIIKLPTDSLDKGPYAFKVFGASSASDHATFVAQFKLLYKSEDALRRGQMIGETIKKRLYDLYGF